MLSPQTTSATCQGNAAKNDQTKTWLPQCYGIVLSRCGGGHDPYKHPVLHTDRWVVVNSLVVLLAKTVNDIVIAFAFSDSENGTASLLTQLLFVFVMTVPRGRRAVSQLGTTCRTAVWYSWSGQ